MTGPLPAGFSQRPASQEDFDAVFALVIASDVRALGEADFDVADLRDEWRHVSFEDDTRVVHDAAGTLAGYALGVDRSFVRPSGAAFTHPAFEGRGVGTWLTRWLEARARGRVDRAPEGARVTLEFGCSADYRPAVELLENEGFTAARYFLRMVIDLAEKPPVAPNWPAQVTVRQAGRGIDERAVYEAVQDSFADHWGHTREPYEDWRKHAVDRETYDPSLWYLAMADDQVVGVSLCTDYPEMDQGWVNTVGVLRRWRQKGVALALLHHSFAEFARRGRAVAALGVDAQSLTGATRVYERAGMHTKYRFALMAKELRVGVDVTTQALT